jgi:uncharacterized protein YjbI with pentapeptide repeats
MRPTWSSRSPAVVSLIGVTATLILTLTIVLTLLISGGAKAVSRNAIPIGGLLISGAVFTSQLVNGALEDQRAREARELEDQRAQEAALQAFLDQLSQGYTFSELQTAPATGHKRAILRAKMQTLLLQLDEERKGVVLSFLHRAKLSRKKEITPYEYTRKGGEERWERWKYPILTLDDIDFSRTKRNPGTKLTFDDLRGIILRDAKLSKVNLSGANLSGADLSNADLSCAQLRKANPQDSERIPGESHNEYDKAVDKVDKLPPGLLETDLSGANLSGANLSGANLSGAVGITNEELEQQAASLKGATMPDGRKYEDWRRDKEGSRNDVEHE